MRGLALVSLYSPPNEHMAAVSHNSLVVCVYNGEEVLLVIDVKAILSVVAMIPFKYTIDGQGNYHFMVEKIGLDVLEVDTQDETK